MSQAIKHRIFASILLAIASPFLIDFMSVMLYGEPYIGQNYTWARKIVATVICLIAVFMAIGAFMSEFDEDKGQ